QSGYSIRSVSSRGVALAGSARAAVRSNQPSGSTPAAAGRSPPGVPKSNVSTGSAGSTSISSSFPPIGRSSPAGRLAVAEKASARGAVDAAAGIGSSQSNAPVAAGNAKSRPLSRTRSVPRPRLDPASTGTTPRKRTQPVAPAPRSTNSLAGESQ